MALFRPNEGYNNQNAPQQQQAQQIPQYQPSVLELTKSRGKKVGKYLLILYAVLMVIWIIFGLMAGTSFLSLLKGAGSFLLMLVCVWFSYLFVIFFGSFWIKD